MFIHFPRLRRPDLHSAFFRQSLILFRWLFFVASLSYYFLEFLFFSRIYCFSLAVFLHFILIFSFFPSLYVQIGQSEAQAREGWQGREAMRHMIRLTLQNMLVENRVNGLL